VFNLSDKVSLLKGSMSLTEVGWHDGKKWIKCSQHHTELFVCWAFTGFPQWWSPWNHRPADTKGLLCISQTPLQLDEAICLNPGYNDTWFLVIPLQLRDMPSLHSFPYFHLSARNDKEMDRGVTFLDDPVEQSLLYLHKRELSVCLVQPTVIFASSVTLHCILTNILMFTFVIYIYIYVYTHTYT
jgi:hypothetical protein